MSSGLIAATPPPLEILTNQASANFPEWIDFRLSLRSPVEILQVYLLYGTDRRSCQESVERQSVPIESANDVITEWRWDLRKRGALPPGVEIWWQWEILDQLGKIHTTTRKSFTLEDIRYEWNRLETPGVLLLWKDGNQIFGYELLLLANSSLQRLEKRVGIVTLEQVRLIIYPTAQDVRVASNGGPEWLGGIAYPDANTILIGISPGDEEWAATAIPHELAHLVIGSIIINCLGNQLPVWLAEGISVYAEGSGTRESQEKLISALKANRLPALRSLSAGFAQDPSLANVEYTASGQVIQYLIETYGKEGLNKLLLGIKSGLTIDAALQDTYNLDTDSLDIAWRAYLGYVSSKSGTTTIPTRPINTEVPTLALWTPAFGNPTATAVPGPPTAGVLHTPRSTQVAVVLPSQVVPPTSPVHEDRQDLPFTAKSPIGWLPLAAVGGLILVVGVTIFLARRVRY